VVANVEDAPGLIRARELGLEARALPHGREASRAAHEAKVLGAIDDAGAAWICLAGYMRLLSAGFVGRFRERILNIHPSLLPAFAGLHPQRQALAAGVKISGCTVHFVDEGLDSGPIVLQRPVPVLDDDDEERLAARILAEEHRAYPAALGRLLAGGWRIDGRRVRFARPGADEPPGG
jgi:phosphoribosylglycinamide formyltransferase-1